MKPSKALMLFVFAMNALVFIIIFSPMFNLGTSDWRALFIVIGLFIIIAATTLSSFIMFLIIFLLRKLLFKKLKVINQEIAEWLTATALIVTFSVFMPPSRNETKVVDSKYKEVLMKKLSENRVEINNVNSLAVDSLENWTRNHLSRYQYLNSSDWLIDSVICLNTTKDKAVMAILNQNHSLESQSDAIIILNGVKVSGRWHFFKGSFISLNRQAHNNSIDEPLSFRKLHELAINEVFSNYLRQDFGNREWKINEKFFSSIERVLAIHKHEFDTEEEWEEWWVKTMTNVNWGKKDTTKVIQ
jgi:hypothetical protein